MSFFWQYNFGNKTISLFHLYFILQTTVLFDTIIYQFIISSIIPYFLFCFFRVSHLSTTPVATTIDLTTLSRLGTTVARIGVQ